MKVVLTSELGQLSKHLRMVGVDTLWNEEASIEETQTLARDDGRVWITSHPEPTLTQDGIQTLHLKSQGFGSQLVEILKHFGSLETLSSGKGFFSLCLQCNHPLLPVAGHQILERIGKDMLLENTEFFFCSYCERVYPKGAY